MNGDEDDQLFERDVADQQQDQELDVKELDAEEDNPNIYIQDESQLNQ